MIGMPLLYNYQLMAIKVLVTAIGQHIIADTKQVSRKDTEETVAYWVKEPRLVLYTRPDGTDDGGVSINFASYCLISDENEFSIAKDHIVSILEPRADVLKSYKERVYPEDESSDPVTQVGEDFGVDGGTTGDGAESAPDSADVDLGEVQADAPAVA